MKKYLILIIVLLVIIIGGFYFISTKPSAAPAIQPSQTLIAKADYVCDAGKTISAAFYDGSSTPAETPGMPPVPGGSVALNLSDGRSMSLDQTLSADGTRYANPDESFVFWSKGNGAMILEDGKQQDYTNCVEPSSSQPSSTDQSNAYTSSKFGFTITVPSGYKIDESFSDQINPQTIIPGVKFTIPASVATGTNLSNDTYLSVESLPERASCSASSFLDGTHAVTTVKDNGVTYSVATSSDAGAGNRYEETIYAFPGNNSCLAIHYFVHYGVLQNYPAGTVKEFDKDALLAQFDAMRESLTISK